MADKLSLNWQDSFNTKKFETPAFKSGVGGVPTIQTPEWGNWGGNNGALNTNFGGTSSSTSKLSLMGEGTDSIYNGFDASGTLGKSPSALGGWVNKYGETALGVAQVGLGVYNALQQSKMNKFMRNYYGKQMDLQTADFENSAHSTNEALTSRKERQLDAMGVSIGSDDNKRQTASYMDKWGVKETV